MTNIQQFESSLENLPPLGKIPETMYAAVIRESRFGVPKAAIDIEEVKVPPVGRKQVLVMVMAAGINYNNVWAALGNPVNVIDARRRKGDNNDFHIGGSDGSGIVWAVGEDVTSYKVGDHVVISCAQWDESADDIRRGVEPITSSTTQVWGYELNYGSFAQFTVVDDYQCHPKPANLTWEEAACYLLTGVTAWRQLTGWQPHTVKPGDSVLIWGGAGGLGSMAIQITRLLGGRPVAVVSDDKRAKYCLDLGAVGVINRKDYCHWGRIPNIDTVEYIQWMQEARRFGKEFYRILGSNTSPKIVLEHVGQDTVPTSMFMCASGGMVVLCGGTSGYNGDMDLRYLWMRQKRLQGSHYGSIADCRHVTELVGQGLLKPCLSETGRFYDIATLHQKLYENRAFVGNMAALVNAPAFGMKDSGL